MALSMIRTMGENYKLSETNDNNEERIAWLTGYFAAKIGEFYYENINNIDTFKTT
jgi:hypothetical protein